MGTDVVKNVNKNNASHAVLFEALALVSFLLSGPYPCTFLRYSSELYVNAIGYGK